MEGQVFREGTYRGPQYVVLLMEVGITLVLAGDYVLVESGADMPHGRAVLRVKDIGVPDRIVELAQAALANPNSHLLEDGTLEELRTLIKNTSRG